MEKRAQTRNESKQSNAKNDKIDNPEMGNLSYKSTHYQSSSLYGNDESFQHKQGKAKMYYTKLVYVTFPWSFCAVQVFRWQQANNKEEVSRKIIKAQQKECLSRSQELRQQVQMIVTFS